MVSAMKRYMQPDAPEPIVEGREYASALDYTQAVRDAYRRLQDTDAPLAQVVGACYAHGLTQRVAAQHLGISQAAAGRLVVTGRERLGALCAMHPDRVTYELKNGALRRQYGS